MHVVFNNHLYAEVGVVGNGQAEQGQQHRVDRAANELYDFVVLQRWQSQQGRNEPQAEQDQCHAGNALGPPVIGAVFGRA